MARQKKDTSTSILRRVLDRTPLRPAHLDGFGSTAATSPAQFAARYFERNSGTIRRCMSIGGENSPVHRPIGRNIVARYTSFNQTFGPIQRALRPQPERQTRKRPQFEESDNYDGFETEDSSSFDYAQEPNYFDQSEQVYAQSNYDVTSPAPMLWESPLNSTPQPVAQRLDFQPANLRYLTNPERQLEPAYRPVYTEAAVERPFQLEVSPTPSFQVPASPVPTSYAQNGDFTEPANFTQSNAFAESTRPELAQSSDYTNIVERATTPRNAEPTFTPVYAPVYRPMVQPALSRALQRTVDATVEQPGAGNLGASPAAVTRRLALPNTIARYRALKQATDKVLLGEQPATPTWEAETSQYLEPIQPQFNQPGIQRVSQEATSLLEVQRIQEATSLLEVQRIQEATSLLEVQRIQEETRALLEARQPVENQGPVSQAGQFIEGQRVAPVSAKPADVKSARESITPPAPETTGLHLIENRQAQENQGLITQPGRLSASETQATVAQLSRTSPVSGRQEMLSGEPTYLPSEAVIQRNYQPTVAPGRVAVGFNRSEVIPALFDSAIPVSLLNNTSLPGEIYPEVQRLGGNRLNAPLTTTAWANNLAALRNNPGIAAGPAALARQLGDAENSGVDAWITGSGAGVYAAQRRVRRNEVVAAETQDRIFSLSENISTVADFQPQLVKSMALEEVAPLPLTRSQAVSLVPSPAAPVISEVVAGRDTSFNPASDASVRRVLDTTVINSDFAFAPERPAQANLALTPFEEQTGAYQTVIPATNQADPAVTSSNLSQTFLAEAQAGVYAQAVPATGPFSTVQRTNQSLNLQPTALQRVFKRMDFETPGNGNLAENTGLSFGNLPFSYAARPGFRRDRSALADMETSGESPFFVGSYRETGQADFAAQPAREANPENVVSRVYREPVSENTAARVYSETDAAASPAREPFFNVEPGAVANPGNAVTFEIIASRSNSQPAFEDGLAQPAGVTGFEGIAAASGGEVSGVHSSSPVISGEAAGFNQPQYLKNSLEATWLSPENRLFVERLPGGSSALQRLLQAPGQLQSFFELNSAASAIDLPSLRNNPGLSANVARTLEEPGGYSWTGNPALNLVLRRRATRSNQAGSQVEFEGGSLPGNYQGFEPASLAQNEGPSGSLALTQPEAVQRTSLTRTEPSQPVSQASQTSLNPRLSVAQSAQPGIFQSGANQETAARIQRNYAGAVEPGQSNPAGGSFTISGDWLAQLQSRYEGFSVGQLNGPTGLVMRLLTEDGNARQSMNVSNFGTAPAFETGPGFNYAVPPLLWRKVSDYAPESGIFPFPEMAMRSDQSPTYTSPGEVLRAFDREDPVFNRSEEYLAPSERTAESASSARLDLPMLRQTHRLLQRIARLEKTNTSLELAHRMEEAGQATSSVPGLGQFANPMPGALQRINDTAAHLASPETGLRPTAPAPLRMTDVPVNRPTDSRFLEVDPEILEDAAVASPLPEIRTVEVRVPDYREYRTPLETAAARNSVSGPNIGQGEILQPLAIQRKAATNSQAAHYAPLAQPSLHNVLKTSIGKTLDHPVQRRMTNIFGAHFHDVKVHTGDEAAQATRHVGAEAFTLGSDIYFAPGRYQPDTHAGQALIGHELTHVIQQSSLPSLGNGRIPETSSHGQTLEHHAIANEQLILRHLSNSNSDHDHSLSSSEDGRLSFQGNHFSPSYSTASATIERSYQPVAEQYNHPPINPSHLKNDSGSNSDGNYNGDSSPIQRVVSGSRPARSVQRAINYEIDSHPANNSTDVDDIIKQQEDIDQLARKVYQIIRDELMIERERGFGPSNKFF